ncbi:MAG: hypothetical protein IPI73_04215 [Betaproteobacteria bacterium]|nr:hypothetical protein [Betaproteobacteria bacterium]
MWVVNLNSNDATKIRASDGIVVATYPVGSGPQGIAFDGANMWVANNACSGECVTKLRASDGVILGTFAAGAALYSIAFDGVNMWAVSYIDGTITKL